MWFVQFISAVVGILSVAATAAIFVYALVRIASAAYFKSKSEKE